MQLYSLLPSVEEVLCRPAVQSLLETHPRRAVLDAVRRVLADLRAQIQSGTASEAAVHQAVEHLHEEVQRGLEGVGAPRLRRVINATGVLLHTNLGRAPLSRAAVQRIAEIAGGYCNLEYDLAKGERGSRHVLAEETLIRLLHTLDVVHEGRRTKYAAAVVNNCAAATYLVLNTLAEGGEVLVSRGELVEIGGGFRIPEVLEKSGARLREVGTTNKTRLRDYAEAIGPETRLILRVHQANFRMVGFTEQPALQELAALSERSGIPLFEDQGTGCVIDLAAYGLQHESSWVTSLKSGAAVVAASGDKLFGGPQCGLLVGEPALIAKMRSNPLFRALRVDKLIYAALEATLSAYLAGVEESIPVVRMLQLTPGAIQARCEALMTILRAFLSDVETVPVQSVVGGGTTPGASLPSYAVSLRHPTLSEQDLAGRLRALPLPIVGRVREGRVLLDLRTVAPEEDSELLASLRKTWAADGVEQAGT